MEIQFRRAVKRDADVAAELLAATMGGYGIATFGLEDEMREVNALKTWFLASGNRFSYELTWLALAEGEVAGLLLNIRGDQLAALERGLVKYILKIYSLGQVIRLWRLMVIGRGKEAKADEYLLAHLAVAPQFMRRGVGKALLEKAAEEAKNNGFSRLVLEVEIGNTPAEKLYEGAGFTCIHTTFFNQHARALHCAGFHKMIKIV